MLLSTPRLVTTVFALLAVAAYTANRPMHASPSSHLIGAAHDVVGLYAPSTSAKVTGEKDRTAPGNYLGIRG